MEEGVGEGNLQLSVISWPGLMGLRAKTSKVRVKSLNRHRALGRQAWLMRWV
jgi:hypothetical protein